MIWLLSDIHGGKYSKGLNEYLSFCKKEDILIVLGDVELYFDGSDKNNAFSDFFTSLNCNIAIVDGNHDNYDYLEALPIEEWNGGRVHRISDSIVHLMRGHIFDIEGNSFLVMGGCGSTDKWKSTPLWWAREQAGDEELSLAVENLKKRDNKVDYILTHKCSNPEHTFRYDSAERFAEYIEKNIEYKQWYAGHWHESKALDERHTIIFDVPKPLIKIQE